MCGRFTLTRMKSLGPTFADLPAEFLASLPSAAPRYNIAPTQQILAFLTTGPTLLRWGLIPFWAKDTKIASSLINARSETAPQKPAFRDAFAKRRCLIPADGFYEWRKNRNGSKTPLYIRKKDRSLFVFAGLYDSWKSPAGEVLRTCTILTTSANALMAPIHERMPVILNECDYHRWLDTDRFPPNEAVTLLVPCAPDSLEAYPVSPRVNTPKNDSSDLIVPEPEGFVLT